MGVSREVVCIKNGGSSAGEGFSVDMPSHYFPFRPRRNIPGALRSSLWH